MRFVWWMHFRRLFRVWTSFTWIHSRDSVDQRVRRTYLMNYVDLVQLGGLVTNLEDPYTVVRDRGCRTDLPQSQVEQSGEQKWKNPGDPPLWIWSCGTKITISSGLCCRYGS